ncbi:MAG: addiction module protein [Acidobacteriota bacterium]
MAITEESVPRLPLGASYNPGMVIDAGQLLKDALGLPPEARAALADSLLDSLDTVVDEGAEESWRREIQHRIHQIETGTVVLIPWEDAERRLRLRLRGE